MYLGFCEVLCACVISALGIFMYVLCPTPYLAVLQGNLPEIMLPQLPEPFKPSRQQRTSSFDVLFLDSDLRITRGSRGELRIFVKT